MALLGTGGSQAADSRCGKLSERRLALGKPVVEHDQLVPTLDHASALEKPEDAHANHLQQVGHFPGLELRGGVENRHTALASRVYAIQGDRVKVWVEPQVGARALHDRDRAALADDAELGAELVPIEAEHRVSEDAHHGAEQLAVVGEPGPQLERQREDKLPKGHAGDRVVEGAEALTLLRALAAA